MRTLRTTVLRDLEGMVHHIPNGTIEIATNMTMDFAQVDLNIGVGYDSDIDHVEKVTLKDGTTPSSVSAVASGASKGFAWAGADQSVTLMSAGVAASPPHRKGSRGE